MLLFNRSHIPTTLKDRLYRVLKKNAHNVIATCGQETITGNELQLQIASFIQSLSLLHVQAGDVIACCVRRNFNQLLIRFAPITGNLVYLPISPSCPNDRLLFMLQNSKAAVFIIEDQLESKFEDIIKKLPSNCMPAKLVVGGKKNLKLICLDPNKKISRDKEKLTNSNDVYVRYTSGSTGFPKGVVIHQKAILHFLDAIRGTIPITKHDTVLALTQETFDISDLEILSLLLGCKVVIATEQDRDDPKKIIALLNKHPEITVIQATPSMYQMLINCGWKNSNAKLKILCGGEALTPQLAKALLLQSEVVINLYGPTETTIWAALLRLLLLSNQFAHTKYVPLGQPLGKTEIYILKDGKPITSSEIGEIGIAGPLLGRYLDQNANKSKFIQHPYKANEQLYLTGDQGYIGQNGNVCFLGRITEGQEKILGHRVELGEIESCIRQYSGVTNCAVIIKKFGDNSILIAYLQCQAPVDRTELKKYLSGKIESHMIPTFFITTPQLPLTSHDKVDKVALLNQEIALRNSEECYIPLSTPIEKQLAQMWKTILLDKKSDYKVGANDNFFALGGNSLLATSLLAAIVKEFKVEINLGELNLNPTLSMLANKIQNAKKIDKLLSPRHKVDKQLSEPERRLLLLENIDQKEVPHNILLGYTIIGKFDYELFRKCILRMIDRHQAFRTVYSANILAGEGQRIILSNDTVESGFVCNYIEDNKLVMKIEDSVELITKDLFNLKEDILIRCYIFHSPDKTTHTIIFNIHHIALGGVFSEYIFHTELSALYNNNGDTSVLSKAKYSYQDYIEFQQKRFQEKTIEEKIKFWLDKLKDAPLYTDLPVDFSKQKKPNHAGDLVSFKLSTKVTNDVKEIAKKYETTPFVILLSIFILSIYRHTNNPDIVVGTSSDNRPNIEGFNNVIGFFINVLLLRFDLSKNLTFGELINEVKKIFAEALSNEIPFEKIIQQLNPQRQGSESLVNSVFTWDGEIGVLNLAGATTERYPINPKYSRLDLEMHAGFYQGDLEFAIYYSSEIFKQKTIQNFYRHFECLLLSMVENPKQLASSVDILTEEEKKLIDDFNASPYPSRSLKNTRSLKAIFEEDIVPLYANDIALQSEKEQLSYLALNNISNQFARFILDIKKEHPTVRIGIIMQQSLYTKILHVACMKNGVPYVSISSNTSPTNIKYILQQSQVNVVFSDPTTNKMLPSMPNKYVVVVDQFLKEKINTYNKSNLEIKLKPEDEYCVVFSSGTTGTPKGVKLSQEAIIVLGQGAIQKLEISKSSKIAAFSRESFDAHLWEFIQFLLAGATLCVFPQDGLLPEKLFNTLKEYGITHITLTPSILLQVISATIPLQLPSSLQCVVSVGEECSNEIKNLFLSNSKIFVNAYGPSEGGVCSSIRVYNKKADIGRQITIGTSLPGKINVILSPELNLTPPGVAGELCIGGYGLMLGYTNPELTKGKFIDHPRYGKLYKTGDKVKMVETPDKNIELVFDRRICPEDQIKYRGQLFSLYGAKAIFKKYPSSKNSFVTDAYAIAKQVGEQQKVIVYVSFDWGKLLPLKIEERNRLLKIDQTPLENEWKKVFDTMVYNNLDIKQYNFIGWQSKITREKIDASEMNLWMQCTINNIGADGVEALELGCGTGLILRALCSQKNTKIQKYVATDISPSVITYLQKSLKKYPLNSSTKVECICASADKVKALLKTTKQQHDLLIINSVIQYFPSEDYLTKMLQALIAYSQTIPNGKIFIGDIRNFALLEVECLEEALLKFSNSKEYNLAQLKELAKIIALKDKELVIDQNYFSHIANMFGVKGLLLQLKSSACDNELFKYRYDVIFFAGEQKIRYIEDIKDKKTILYDKAFNLEKALQEGKEVIHIQNIPNPRFNKISTILLSEDNQEKSAKEIYELYQTNNTINKLPLFDEYDQLGKKYNYKVIYTFPSNGDKFSLDVVFDKHPQVSLCFNPAKMCKTSKIFTNDPSLASLRESLEFRLCQHFFEKSYRKLPLAGIVIMPDRFPTNNHGKINHRLLPPPQRDFSNFSIPFIVPKNPGQQELISIWREVLGDKAERIGMMHDFFDAGGTSLLIPMLVKKINNKFNTDLSEQDIYNFPTPEKLFHHKIEQQQKIKMSREKEELQEKIAYGIVKSNTPK